MIICTLKQLRFDKGISQKELSNLTSIRYPTISEMERGASKAYSVENLNKLCAFFNCQPADLIEYVPDEPLDKTP